MRQMAVKTKREREKEKEKERKRKREREVLFPLFPMFCLLVEGECQILVF